MVMMKPEETATELAANVKALAEIARNLEARCDRPGVGGEALLQRVADLEALARQIDTEGVKWAKPEKRCGHCNKPIGDGCVSIRTIGAPNPFCSMVCARAWAANRTAPPMPGTPEHERAEARQLATKRARELMAMAGRESTTEIVLVELAKAGALREERLAELLDIADRFVKPNTVDVDVARLKKRLAKLEEHAQAQSDGGAHTSAAVDGIHDRIDQLEGNLNKLVGEFGERLAKLEANEAKNEAKDHREFNVFERRIRKLEAILTDGVVEVLESWER